MGRRKGRAGCRTGESASLVSERYKQNMSFEDVPEIVRKRMSRIRKTGSKPEVLVRQIAHRLGYRFRINRSDLPGTPAIVFPKLRKIIFVHGCFWHQHCGCRYATIPRVRQDYWLPKLART